MSTRESRVDCRISGAQGKLLKVIGKMVGVSGFEPPAPSFRTMCANQAAPHSDCARWLDLEDDWVLNMQITHQAGNLYALALPFASVATEKGSRVFGRPTCGANALPPADLQR